MKLEGKVAIVTGGARDLGRAISVKLAAEGAKVCLNYFDNEADAQETLALIKNVGGEAIAVQGDMTKAAAVKNLFAECNKAFGDKVDVLVNVVGGIVGRKKITEQDEDWYDFLMDVNMRSVFLCTREVVPMMPEGGSIVNFSSLAARDGGGNGASMYATAIPKNAEIHIQNNAPGPPAAMAPVTPRIFPGPTRMAELKKNDASGEIPVSTTRFSVMVRIPFLK